MLDLMGSGYVIEHCVAAHNSRIRQETFEDYVSDVLYYISRQLGGKLDKRLHDLRHPAPVDERPPQEIMDERLQKFGITVVK